MSNFTSSIKRSRFVRRSKQRKGLQLQKLEGQETDGLASIIRSAQGQKGSVVSQVQTKIAVGQANDAYEVEADNVADKVVANSAKQGIQTSKEEAAQAKPLLQKQEEEEAAQAKPLLQKQEEEEAAQAKPLLQKQEEEEAAQAKPLLQKQEEEEEAQAKPLLQKQEEEEAAQTKSQSGQASPQQVNHAVSQRLSERKGSGQKMPANLLNFMQQQFQKDFSGVRIHTDAEAADISQSMRAQAFALGKDIYFNQGKYQPDSSQGKRLLAHELTHVVQQNSKLRKPKVNK